MFLLFIVSVCVMPLFQIEDEVDEVSQNEFNKFEASLGDKDKT